MTSPSRVALCFGEILWDFLPDGLFLGGAPANVGCHLERLGQTTHVVSAVGRDVLGDEILRRLNTERLDASGVHRHPTLGTGYVRATLGAQRDAAYEIVANVAWDEIPVPTVTQRAAREAGALIFGSLAQRSRFNRESFAQLLAELPPTAWRVFDVNLRAPHDDLALVHRLARHATLIKLNADEAARLANAPTRSGDEEAHARGLSASSGCKLICVTAAERGAGLLADGQWHWEPGRKVDVVDTIGAGDSFLARLVAGLLRGETPGPDLLARACRLGEWVAAHRGATPAYDATTPV